MDNTTVPTITPTISTVPTITPTISTVPTANINAIETTGLTVEPTNLLGILVPSIKSIGAGMACSGLIGAGIGIGLVFASLIKSFAINPKLKGQLFGYAIMGFALTEAMGLLSLMMACVILYT